MNKFALALLLALLPGTASLAQQPLDVKNLGREWVESEFPSGGKLRMDLQSAGVHVSGSADNKVRLRCIGRWAQEGTRAHVELKTSGNTGDLTIEGGPHNDFELEIQVPRLTNLVVRMPAGELDLQGVEGDKDVRMHAGEVNIQVADPDAYGPVTASLWAGEINGGPFGPGREGLFRSFHAQGKGRYAVQVRLKAGEVTFRK